MVRYKCISCYECYYVFSLFQKTHVIKISSLKYEFEEDYHKIYNDNWSLSSNIVMKQVSTVALTKKEETLHFSFL